MRRFQVRRRRRKASRRLALALAAAVIGYVVQSTFSDNEIDVAQYCSGLTGLSQ